MCVIRVEVKVARPAARVNFDVEPGRSELARDGVQYVRLDAVQPEVVDVDPPRLQIQVGRVRMRDRLPLCVYTASTLVLDEVRRRVEAPVGLDGQHGDTAAVVVGDHRVPARGVDTDVARPGTERRLPVQEGQTARCPVYRKCAECAADVALVVVDLGNGVKV